MQEVAPGADSRAIAAAACRLCERFASQATPLIGDAGAGAIYARSLHLTQRKFPGTALPGGSGQDGGPFARARLFLESQEPAAATEAAVVLLATVGGLLASFIGESLTTRLLRQAWPDFGTEIPRSPRHE